ncbi:MAG: glycosyltransferase family 1 protein [Myxococcales bacterium]|nr:glycosyltransferase family 1 protein [Myxococcales bacterium]
MTTDPLRVLVDVTTWVSGRTGVGLYTERLLRAWLDLGTRDELLCASNVGHSELAGLPVIPVGPAMPLRAAWMQSALPLQWRRLRPDVAFFPNYLAPLHAAGPYVVTVHDLAVVLHAETFPWRKRVLQRLALPHLCRHAAAVLTPSESTRQDLLRLFDGIDPARVVAIPLAPPEYLRVRPDLERIAAIRHGLGLPARYVLAVGTLEPRKNLPRLLAAFAQVAVGHPGVGLVVAGGKGWRDDGIGAALAASPVRDRITTVGYVGPEALRVLYAEADVMAYPSLYEGFGLPVVEAMAAGAPVLTSRGSSLDEAAGGAAVAVDPLDVGAIAAGLDQLLGDARLRGDLRERGRLRAADLTWQRTAERTRSVVANVRDHRAPGAGLA